MVNSRFFLLFCLIPMLLLAKEPTLSVGLNETLEGRPARFFVSILADHDIAISTDSFKLGGKKLEVQSLGESSSHFQVYVNGKQVTENSIEYKYAFSLPPQASGSYVLPEVSVVIAGSLIKSAPLTYQVKKIEQNPNLHITSFIKQSKPYYPGQILTWGYDIQIQEAYQDFEWLQQDFPLLSQNFFSSFSEPEVSTLQKGPYIIKHIQTKVRVKKEGSYHVSPAFIMAAPLSRGFFRHPIIDKKIQVQGGGLEIEVLPFPLIDKPATFNGNVGKFGVKAELISKPQVMLGDKLTLKIEVFGDEEIQFFSLPDLRQLQEFSDNFRFNDLLADSQIQDGKKVFIIEMRPLTEAIKAIPSIELSSFDPITGKYQLESTPSFSITVTPSAVVKPIIAEKKQERQNPVVLNSKDPSAFLKHSSSNIEIFGLVSSDDIVVQNFYISSQQVLHFLELLLILFAAQLILIKLWRKKAQIPEKRALKTFNEALSQKEDQTVFLTLLERAFIERLYEQGHIMSPQISYADLDSKKSIGKIKSFFEEIEASRYGNAPLEINDELVERAHQLFKGIK